MLSSFYYSISTLLGAVTIVSLYESLSSVSVSLQRRKTLIFTVLSCCLRSMADIEPDRRRVGRETDKPLTTENREHCGKCSFDSLGIMRSNMRLGVMQV